MCLYVKDLFEIKYFFEFTVMYSTSGLVVSIGSLSFYPAIIKSDFKLFNFINDLIETLYNLEIE